VEPEPATLLRLAPGVYVPRGALTYTFTASGGPGGQNVNKRATRCQLRVALADLPLTPAQIGRLTRLAPSLVTDAGELLITADEHKSQGQNREEATRRLAELVRRALIAPKVRCPTKPTRGSRERRLKEKKSRGEVKRRRRELE
jgi:ribosome-associated protein